MMHTRKRSLDEASKSPPPTPATHAVEHNDNIPVIEPSMLRFLTPESTASPPSTPDSSADSLDGERPKKKARTRRNARTEEEKQARAEERAIRNRRAAQESRDRKKQLFDTLERDNERLRRENELLKEKLAELESRVTVIEDGDGIDGVDGAGRSVKEEGDSEVAQTHYPAVVMSPDQQCQVISLSPSPRPQTLTVLTPLTFQVCPCNPSRNSTLMKQLKMTLTGSLASRIPSKRLPSISLPQQPWLTTCSALNFLRRDFSFEFRATSDGLNIGSPHIGAEMISECSDAKRAGVEMCFEAGSCVADLSQVLSFVNSGQRVNIVSDNIINKLHKIYCSFIHEYRY